MTNFYVPVKLRDGFAKYLDSEVTELEAKLCELKRMRHDLPETKTPMLGTCKKKRYTWNRDYRKVMGLRARERKLVSMSAPQDMVDEVKREISELRPKRVYL